jgi:Fe-S-cluster-containing dehydrogenase component
MTRLTMAIDTGRCMGCKACVLACQQRNDSGYDHARNWVRPAGASAGKGPGFALRSYQPGSCMQCAEPLCVEACPTGATYRGGDGVVYIDAPRCIGCAACLGACPYRARFRHPASGRADKCDYCREGRAAGLEPACVRVCPTGVRTFGDLDAPESPVAKIVESYRAKDALTYVESPVTPTGPTLVYLGPTSPTDWPGEAKIPAPVAAMSVAAAGIRWLGGLSLFGVLGVFVKQLFLPSDDGENLG